MSVTPSLLGVRAKLANADLHIQTLDQALGAVMRSDPATGQPVMVRVEFDGENRQGQVVFTRPPDGVLAAWAVMVGDVLHNLRSALDHLAWQLVLLNQREPSMRTSFPIFDDEGKFESDAPRAMKGMKWEHRALIESVQPYRTWEDQPRSTLLYLVHDLNNIDKHRELHATSFTLQTFSHDVSRSEVPARAFDPIQTPQVVEDGTVLGRFSWEPGDTAGDVRVDHGGWIEPGFENVWVPKEDGSGFERAGILNRLMAAWAYINTLLSEQFEPLFPAP